MVDLQQALQLGHRPLGPDDPGADSFGTVDGGATADSHDSLAAIFQIELQPLLHVIRGGVGSDSVIDRAGNPRLLHGLQHGNRKPQLHQTGIGDHQDPVNSLFR